MLEMGEATNPKYFEQRLFVLSSLAYKGRKHKQSLLYMSWTYHGALFRDENSNGSTDTYHRVACYRRCKPTVTIDRSLGVEMEAY